MVSIKRAKEGILKVWKDPVWSKVISAGILGLIAISWAKMTNHSWQEVYDIIVGALSFKTPIWLILSLAGLYFIIKLCINVNS